MDVAAFSSAMSQSNLQVAVGVSVLKKSMDASSQTAELLIQAMGQNSASAPHPYLGKQLDISV